MMKRDTVIAANWKMNKTPKETKELILKMLDGLRKYKSKIIICVPYVDLSVAVECTLNSNIIIGAQNCHWETSGAFTGEISLDMLKEIGVSSVIIGHSERRRYFNETDEIINKKIRLLVNNNMNIILCVGETLDEMKNHETISVISKQIKTALCGINKEEVSNIIIAYEPVWAIGSGMTALPEDAGKICGQIRGIMRELYDEEVAEKLIVQYGGSINSENVMELLSQNEIDGGLIGGASLKADEFVRIVELADKIIDRE